MSSPNHYEKIEEMVRQLRRTTDSQLDGKILDDTFAAFDEAMPRSMVLRVFVFRMIKIAAAVVILFVLAAAAQKYFAQQKVQPQIAQAAKNEIVAVIDDSNKTVILSQPAGTATATRDTVKLQEELKQVIQLISANDTNGLAKMLSGAKAESRLAAVIYLANMDSSRSIEILDILSDKLDSKEPDNLFAVTSAVLKKRLEDKKRESNQPLPDEKKSKKDEIVIKCVLSGFVTSAETGKPVSDVNICLEGRSAACTITDANGFYCFDKAGEEGEYRIAIHSKEYVDPCSDNPKLMVSLRNDANTVENLMLIPACMINIEVVNEANEPVKDAFVYEVRSVSYEEPNRESYRFATAGHTNEKGEVSLGGFESSETPRLFIAAYNDYAPESLTVILNNHLTTPFYRIVVKKGQDTKADSNQPLP
jgi:hypothetical protein